MTTKQLDMSFDAMSLRDTGLQSPIDRRYSQYGSERTPSTPLTRRPTNGSQRNSVRGDGKDIRRQSSRMSVANMNWSPPQGQGQLTPMQSPPLMQHQQPQQSQPLYQQHPMLQQQQQYQHHIHQPVQQQPQLQPQPQSQQLQLEEHVDTIPTAIVIKNIPFSIKRDALLAFLDNLDIPKPYAFNYHFDNGIFRGLAFANYRTAEETDIVVAAVNGLEVQGRKLRVEFKKVMPAAEQEKREQEKLAAAQAAAAAEAARLRELEMMEMLEQERREQERREYERREYEYQQSSQYEVRRNRSSVLLERRDSNRSLHERDDYSSASNMNQLDLNDGETLAFYDRLLMFRGDPTKDDMIFPENLSARQRRILHLIADKLSLYHYSEGEGNLRRLIIMKTPPPTGTPGYDVPHSRSSPKQRPLSYAGRGSVRAESPVLKSRSPLADITSSGSASPTRSLYRKSMVMAPELAGSVIYPIRQPKGPEAGKAFTIREPKQLRDGALMAMTPSPTTPTSATGSMTGGPFEAPRPRAPVRTYSNRSLSLDAKAPVFKPASPVA
ncbi:hypothetical protein DFQ26_000045 [Actinomortierella ambigua]|nr:hypothetical protein DFQ26_000045 [Actinomortierella ambigua]